MTNRSIIFQYCQNDTTIQCQSNELMGVIFRRYVEKVKLPLDEIYFIYDGRQLDPNETLAQVTDKKDEILILVNKFTFADNEDSLKVSDFIKSFVNDAPAIIKFLNDYSLDLFDKKNGSKKIKLRDYQRTQLVDEKKIICCKCSRNKKESSRNMFYYCYDCDKNFCPIHESVHKKEHKNIVDHSLKYFRCSSHKDKELNSYCVDCSRNLCLFCMKEHEKHKTISFSKLFQNQDKIKDFVGNIEKVMQLVDVIVDWLQRFKKNLNVFLEINKKIEENIEKMNVNYELLKTAKNLMDASFLREDLVKILRSEDQIEQIRKIASIYKVMEDQSSNVIRLDDGVQSSEAKAVENAGISNEVAIKVQVKEEDVKKTVYFLDNTKKEDGDNYYENGWVVHDHDNLKELNDQNMIMSINGETAPFKKYFIPAKSGTYLIKLVFKDKLLNCAYMFCGCKSIIEIDFSKFNTKNVTSMLYMFGGPNSGIGCESLSRLDLSSFNTQNVTDMSRMFYGCHSLISLNLSSFNTQNVTNMDSMSFSVLLSL